jgi:hypothetical protein
MNDIVIDQSLLAVTANYVANDRSATRFFAPNCLKIQWRAVPP